MEELLLESSPSLEELPRLRCPSLDDFLLEKCPPSEELPLERHPPFAVWMLVVVVRLVHNFIFAALGVTGDPKNLQIVTSS